MAHHVLVAQVINYPTVIWISILLFWDRFPIAEHTSSTSHWYTMDDTKILVREDKWFLRKIREALHIHKRSPTLYRDHEISPILFQLLLLFWRGPRRIIAMPNPFCCICISCIYSVNSCHMSNWSKYVNTSYGKGPTVYNFTHHFSFVSHKETWML